MPRPDTSEYADPYRAYVALAREEDIVPAMRSQLVNEFASSRLYRKTSFHVATRRTPGASSKSSAI